MSHTFGENPSKNNTRKAVAIPRRVCVDGPWDEGKKQQSGRFGLMCFSANRNKED
jgi:hypothetical protein